MEEFNALAKQYVQEREYIDYKVGLICSVLANVFRRKGSRVLKPDDFMPLYQKPKQTPEEIFRIVQSWHRHLTRKK